MPAPSLPTNNPGSGRMRMEDKFQDSTRKENLARELLMAKAELQVAIGKVDACLAEMAKWVEMVRALEGQMEGEEPP